MHEAKNRRSESSQDEKVGTFLFFKCVRIESLIVSLKDHLLNLQILARYGINSRDKFLLRSSEQAAGAPRRRATLRAHYLRNTAISKYLKKSEQGNLL